MKNKVMDFTFKYGSLIVIALIILFLSFWDEHFFTYSNLTDILRSISIVTFVAIGVTFSLTVDGFDFCLSVSTVSLQLVASALMVWYQQPLVVVIVVPLMIGAIVGLINSFLIVRVRIPDLLATLAIMYIVAGVHKTFTKGYSIYNNMQLTDVTTAPGVFDRLLLVALPREAPWHSGSGYSDDYRSCRCTFVFCLYSLGPPDADDGR